jgi:hypothetical protein
MENEGVAKMGCMENEGVGEQTGCMENEGAGENGMPGK